MEREIKEALQKFIDTVEPKIKAIDGPDYYVSQSQIKLNPELLIIGINPAGGKKLSESNFLSKKPENLIYGNHQYLENPDWVISKKLNHILSGKNARKVYENAVIINYVAVNTNKESELSNPLLKEIVQDCENFSENFIYSVLKPKKVLLLGPAVVKMMKIKFHHKDDSVLRTDDDRSYLVLKTTHREIPHYLIYHPSTPALNGFDHLELKKEFFENLFSEL